MSIFLGDLCLTLGLDLDAALIFFIVFFRVNDGILTLAGSLALDLDAAPEAGASGGELLTFLQ